jgi:hypothetical protein
MKSSLVRDARLFVLAQKMEKNAAFAGKYMAIIWRKKQVEKCEFFHRFATAISLPRSAINCFAANTLFEVLRKIVIAHGCRLCYERGLCSARIAIMDSTSKKIAIFMLTLKLKNIIISHKSTTL